VVLVALIMAALAGCSTEADTTTETTTTKVPPTTTTLVLPKAVVTTVPAPDGLVGTDPPATDSPATAPPEADPPVTDPPATDPPVYYANCTAVRDAGAAPIYRGEPGYRSALDRDGDGIACDTTG
jgi:hypothetical protein